MKRHLIYWVLYAAVACGLLVCTTVDPEPCEEGELSIQLSLYQTGTTRADYNGSDIVAIVQFSDSVACTFDNKRPEHIQVYTGSGRFRIPDEAITSNKVDYLEIPFYWISKPRNSDSSGTYYDTLFIQVGQSRSNTVRVNVVNLSPFIDSVTVGDTLFKVHEDIYGNNEYSYILDTLTELNLKVSIYDPDNDPLKVEWKVKVYDTLLFPKADEKQAIYMAPPTNFVDTLTVVVSDGKLGNVQVNIVLKRVTGLSSVSIRQIAFGDTVFTGTAPVVNCYVVAIDTDTVIVSYSNFLPDPPVISYTAKKGTLTSLSSVSGSYRARYIYPFPAGTDTIRTDTSIVLDTLSLQMVSSIGDTVRNKIVIIQRSVNSPPIIDSLKLGGNLMRELSSWVEPGDSLILRVFSHDPDGVLDSMTVLWTGIDIAGEIVSTTGHSLRYVSPDSGTDTLLVTVTDTTGFSDERKITLYINQPPVFDSIKIGDTSFAGIDPAFSYLINARDTVLLVPYYHDPAGGNDTLVASWAGSDLTSRVIKLSDDSIRYIAPSSGTYVLRFTVTDTFGIGIQQTFNLYSNLPPVIDSVNAGGFSRAVATDSVWWLNAGDSEWLRAVYHDPNSSVEALTLTWRDDDISGVIDSITGDSALYIVPASGRDTVELSVTDSKGLVNRQKLIFYVNQYPAIDSIIVNDTLFRPALYPDADFLYTIAPPDTFQIRLLYHDPELASSITFYSQVSGGEQPAKVFTTNAFTYITSDSTYTDTVMCTVRDPRGASDTAMVYLDIVK